MTAIPDTLADSITPLRSEFEALVETDSPDPPCVSIYIPAHEHAPPRDQDPIRFRNAVREVDDRLEKRGVEQRQRESMLRPAQQLIDDRDFWQRGRRGLAMFLRGGSGQYCELPYEPPEFTFVGEHYALRCLVPTMTDLVGCCLLTLSQDRVRLYRVGRTDLERREISDTPTSIEEMLRFIDAEKSVQFHTGTQPAPAGRKAAVFHGQGAHPDEEKLRLREFLTMVSDGVERALRSEPDVPVVLAGDDHVLATFRNVSDLTNIADQAVTGNVDHLDEGRLFERVQPLRDDLASAHHQRALDHYGEAVGSGRASNDPDVITNATKHGLVELLFAPMDLTGGEESDTAETAVIQTLRTSGEVRVLDRDRMPDDAVLAAVLRPGARSVIEST